MQDEDLLEDEIREGAAPVVAPADPSKRRQDPEGSSWAKIAVVIVLLGGGVVALLLGTDVGNVFTYSRKVDDVMAAPNDYVGRQLRVEGQLRQGSIVFENEPTCEHRFVLTRGDQEMPVRFPRCVVPDTFRDGVEMDVQVEGRLQPDHTFVATEVIPRCPSKYEMRQRQQNGESMPHSVPVAGETS